MDRREIASFVEQEVAGSGGLEGSFSKNNEIGLMCVVQHDVRH